MIYGFDGMSGLYVWISAIVGIRTSGVMAGLSMAYSSSQFLFANESIPRTRMRCTGIIEGAEQFLVFCVASQIKNNKPTIRARNKGWVAKIGAMRI